MLIGKVATELEQPCQEALCCNELFIVCEMGAGDNEVKYAKSNGHYYMIL